MEWEEKDPTLCPRADSDASAAEPAPDRTAPCPPPSRFYNPADEWAPEELLSEAEIDAQVRRQARRARVQQLLWQIGTATVIIVSLFFMFLRISTEPEPMPSEPQILQTEPSEPESDSVPSVFPTQPDLPDIPVQDNCFVVENGQLVFLRGKFHDTPILRIPEAIHGQTVTSIPDGLFEGLSGVTTIWLPSTIRSIGNRAFADCPDLRGLCIPDSVGSIGRHAFDGCSSLEALYIPLGVTHIGDQAFERCPSLRYIFYSGFYDDWAALYDRYITPFTYVLCLDGDFPHAAAEFSD